MYPLIELLTACTGTLLILYIQPTYYAAYFLFFSALLITIHTDLRYMLISRFTTLFLIPFAFVASYSGTLPVTLSMSILGAIFGYSILYAIAFMFSWFTSKQGMGQGDFDLLAFIGAFTGTLGCWITLLIGSILGSFIGIAYIIIIHGGSQTRIPFGPFLAISAIIYVLSQPHILTFLSLQ